MSRYLLASVRRSVVRRSVAVATLVVIACMVPIPASANPTVVERTRLARGVVYERIDDTSIPIRTFLLIFRPGTAATLDGVLSGDQIGTYEETSKLGAGAGALAAINGDLNSSPGRPTHQYVLDGEVMVTGKRVGVSFGYRQDETGGTLGRHQVRITAVDKTSGSTFRVKSWNEHSPGSDQVVGYTPYGGDEEKPATSQCSARLTSPSRLRWNLDGNGLHRVYTVDTVACSSTTAMAVTSGSIVLTARTYGLGAAFIKGLVSDGRVRVGWRADSPGVLDIVSGNTMILKDGHVEYPATCDTRMCGKNPRTAIGMTANGRVMMLVVDGRSSVSEGFTLHRLGRWMRQLGVVDAVNLDGGGSATMWINGRGVVNDVANSGDVERPVSNAVVILPGPDPTQLVSHAPRAI
jgi:hypothetical protein